MSDPILERAATVQIRRATPPTGPGGQALPLNSGLIAGLILLAALLSAALPGLAGAQGRIDAQDRFHWDLGEYVIHATAVRTDFVPPPVAQRQDIERSTHRGLLNVVVEEKREDGRLEPIEARVEAETTNLIGQVTEIDLEPRRERDTIYYLGTFPVDSREAMDFRVAVQPPDVAEPFVVEFEKQFLTKPAPGE